MSRSGQAPAARRPGAPLIRGTVEPSRGGREDDVVVAGQELDGVDARPPQRLRNRESRRRRSPRCGRSPKAVAARAMPGCPWPGPPPRRRRRGRGSGPARSCPRWCFAGVLARSRPGRRYPTGRPRPWPEAGPRFPRSTVGSRRQGLPSPIVLKIPLSVPARTPPPGSTSRASGSRPSRPGASVSQGPGAEGAERTPP